MVSSLFRLPTRSGQAEYSRIDTGGEDVELEKRHLIEASSDDSSDYSDALPFIQRYTEKRRPRHRCLIALLATITVVASSLAAYHTIHRYQRTAATPCSICAHSALPQWPPASSTDKVFSEEALEMWVAQGRLPSSSHNDKLDFSEYTRIDGITLWVNGSDPRHKAARSRFAANVNLIDQPPSHIPSTQPRLRRLTDEDRNKDLQNIDQRYREQNELLFSLRSSRMYLPDLGTQHVIATDYWDEGTNVVQGTTDRLLEGRRGQLPTWLNTTSGAVAYGSETQAKTPALRMHHDWETFVPLVGSKEEMQTWKERRLPSFNSMAAEAVLGVNLPGLSEYSFLSSDDMFLGQPMSTADFVTPLYGPVLQLKMDQITEYPRTEPFHGIEFASIDYSVALLTKRFGTRIFPYLHHVHKALSKPLLIESRMMWRAEFEEATLKRFRGDGISANSHVLSYGLIMERHREALLWSFLVSKLDLDGDGKLDKPERERAYKLIGTDGLSDITARMRKRTTSDPESIRQSLDSVSFPGPKASRYTFSSFDGHVLTRPSADYTKETGYTLADGPIPLWKSEDESKEQKQRLSAEFCRVSMKICWPRTDRVSKIFTHFTFKEPACGDCLIAYLVEQSGSAGLDAFLPTDTSSLPYSDSHAAIPSWVPAHLSMNTDWTSIDFSLSSVALINRAGWTRRSFSIHLIQRYNYVAADASLSFKMLLNPQSATDLLTEIQDTKPAFICLNDDIDDKLEETRSVMQRFFQAFWPSPSPSEKIS